MVSILGDGGVVLDESDGEDEIEEESKGAKKKSNRKAMNRNWRNQKAYPALKTKAGNQ